MTSYDVDHGNARKDLEKQFLEAATNGDAASIRSMSKLLQTTLPIDLRNNHGWTALMLAARNDHGEAVEEILQHGADATLMNKSGQTALDIAYFWNNTRAGGVIKKFLEAPKSPRKEFVNYFGLNSVDRQSYKRKDLNYVESLKTSKESRFMVFQNLKLLTSKMDPKSELPRSPISVIFLNWEEAEKLLSSDLNSDVVYLGNGRLASNMTINDSLSYFAINLKKELSSDQLNIEQFNAEFVGRGLMAGLMVLPCDVAGLVAQARSILAWHDRYQFCPTCGSQTEMKESGYKRVCVDEKCRSLDGVHNTCFPRIDPVVIALISSTDGTKCLLGRQKSFPKRMYSCLAGFMEAGESMEDAVRREVLEESGVGVGKLTYHSSQPWPFPGQLMVGFVGQALDDKITVDEHELEDARWFERSEVAEALTHGFHRSSGLLVPPQYAIAHQLIKSWVKTSSNL